MNSSRRISLNSGSRITNNNLAPKETLFQCIESKYNKDAWIKSSMNPNFWLKSLSKTASIFDSRVHEHGLGNTVLQNTLNEVFYLVNDVIQNPSINNFFASLLNSGVVISVEAFLSAMISDNYKYTGAKKSMEVLNYFGLDTPDMLTTSDRLSYLYNGTLTYILAACFLIYYGYTTMYKTDNQSNVTENTTKDKILVDFENHQNLDHSSEQTQRMKCFYAFSKIIFDILPILVSFAAVNVTKLFPSDRPRVYYAGDIKNLNNIDQFPLLKPFGLKYHSCSQTSSDLIKNEPSGHSHMSGYAFYIVLFATKLVDNRIGGDGTGKNIFKILARSVGYSISLSTLITAIGRYFAGCHSASAIIHGFSLAYCSVQAMVDRIKNATETEEQSVEIGLST